MEDGSKNVRLVRCPKCENLLPELPSVDVYQCGGCGAVLQASEKSRIGESLGKLESLEEMSEGSESDGVKGNACGKAEINAEKVAGENVADRREKSIGERIEKDIGGVRSRRLGEMPRPARAVVEEVRLPRRMYPDEGPSSSVDRVERIEQDRVELLRQLEELSLLKAQLSRTTERVPVPLDARNVPMDTYPGWSRHQRPPMQSFPGERRVERSLYSNHGIEMDNFYASNEVPVPGYRDPYAQRIIEPGNPSRQYHQHPVHDYFPSHYMGMDASFPTNTFFHQPACSCAHCYEKRWYGPSQAPPGRLLGAPDNHDSRGVFGPRGHHRTNTNPLPMHVEPRPRPLLRMQRSLDTGNRGLGESRVRTVLPVKRTGRRCHPVAGGAPFVTCPNCFELLPLPRKVLRVTSNCRRLRCGSCSTVLSLLFEDSRIVVSVPVDSDEEASSTVYDRSIGVVKESILRSRNNRSGIYSSSGDSSGFNFHLADAELGSSSMERRLNLSDSEKLQGLVSSCSTTSDDEVSPDSVIAQRELPNSEERPTKGTPPAPGSPLHENPPSNQVGSKFEKGNRSKRINQDEPAAAKATSRQNSVKDVVATEMDVSSNEYPSGGNSQDSGDVSKGDHPKAGKGGESFFVGLIKKSFRNHTGENDRSTVFVNGHPISDRLVKKAEKQSGPIHPGHYWYDFRAGFWGAMGHPCLGIIPPFIEEFNFPMPKNCACGNTGVSVNSRELHQKDLDLLASRGLPRTADKSYIIEISGKVFDEESGEELDNLGKLAPTVEKLKRGFGLRVPRLAAA